MGRQGPGLWVGEAASEPSAFSQELCCAVGLHIHTLLCHQGGMARMAWESTGCQSLEPVFHTEYKSTEGHMVTYHTG